MKIRATIVSLSLLGAAFALCSAAPAHAADINAASCSQADVQSAIDSAVDGDTVLIPAGTCAWAAEVSFIDKSIRVLGAGIDQTTITGDGTRFYVGAHNTAVFRISGMTLSGASPGSVFNFKNDTNNPTSGFRVDHIRFVYTDDTATDFFFIVGLIWGVIDHCVVDAPGGIFAQHYAYTEQEGSYSGTTSWSLPLDLGGETAIYVEDSQVNYGAGWFPGMNDSWAGGRLVFRYNDLTRPVFQTHGARGSIRGGLKLEIYGNSMLSDGVAWDRIAQIRSGTGVVFNNQISGYQYQKATLDVPRVCDTGASDFGGWCDGTSAWDGNVGSAADGDAGWPCLDMPGRGTTPDAMPGAAQPSEPYYAWRNGPEATCRAEAGTCTPFEVFECSWGYELCDPGPPTTCDYVRVSPAQSPHVGGVYDAYNSGADPKPGYTPLAYPHPFITDCVGHPLTCDEDLPCTDDCAAGDTGCSADNLQAWTCAEAGDGDSCLDQIWQACADGCVGGVCQGGTCTDECAAGEVGCSADNLSSWACGEANDGDACTERLSTSCDGQQCQQGACVAGPGEGGCSCRMGRASGGAAGMWLALLGLLFGGARARTRARSPDRKLHRRHSLGRWRRERQRERQRQREG